MDFPTLKYCTLKYCDEHEVIYRDDTHCLQCSIKKAAMKSPYDAAVDAQPTGLEAWLPKDGAMIRYRSNDKPAAIKTICDHQWKSYVGFRESYEYCEHCDKKK